MNEKELLEIENIELKLLIEAIYLRYGYDFKNYTKSHLKRRILRRVKLNDLKNITELTEKMLYDRVVLEQILLDLSINVTEMFRFPEFFKDLREEVIPLLKTYPSINIWHAGCSTGEEVISMAILLKEEGLLNRVNIYATDINKQVLDIAKEGIYPIEEVKKWTKNYQKAGGGKSFSDYYVAKYDHAIFDQNLLKNVTFLEHNLVIDKIFIDANLIICRNVLIYFNKELQNQVLELFEESLIPGGIIGIGSKENLRFTSVNEKFESIATAKIYKKKIGC
ncbi:MULTISPECIES: CheR family methyltransferase [Psychrilyobacter]|uniref:Protein-glutamate O-methyltransferase CheR n=1 Tax=Psychrilyobacter piezotolerans TaxID=2293438 RepID=A0ABX9KKQ4_9FUSO|nr:MULTISPECIES: protein-glutamate O-methyltransferase CheR [Psychrilyobacter]MCS5422036.1 protein-glutamate O-methyltransferase CheR [Psychrilyobacter sp. S5]NDI76354.1 protein-glutamate O-methyltransferase CheR [Psychrilyobacter piezotolerans]RDE65952.1 protein-glutamate O-methyltransferase CheR [Psychrilyobacter sp. S5]REI43130.1 protein-glutamate O-methyltransferase CheR [Psychrilyobacter piezotolerans]